MTYFSFFLRLPHFPRIYTWHPAYNVLSFLACYGHLPDADQVVSVSSEQRLAVGGPGEADALWGLGLGAVADHLLSEFVNHNLAFEILREGEIVYFLVCFQ